MINLGLTFRCALQTTYIYVGRDEVRKRTSSARRGRNRSGCNAHKETRVQIVAALLPEEGVSEADGWCPRRNRNNCNPHNASRVQELLHGLYCTMVRRNSNPYIY